MYDPIVVLIVMYDILFWMGVTTVVGIIGGCIIAALFERWRH